MANKVYPSGLVDAALNKPSNYPEPEPDLYVDFSGERYPSTRYDDTGYIVPAQFLGRESGDKIYVLLWGAPPMHRHDWAVWVHVDDTRTRKQVEGG